MKVEARFLPARAAADYLSVSVTQFKRLVDCGTLPGPVRLGKGDEVGSRVVRWDRLALDTAMLGKARQERQRSIEDAIEEIKARQKDARGRNGQGLRV